MTTTVANVIDDLKRDYLFKPNEQPVVVPLSANITDSITTGNYDPNYLTTVEEDALGQGTIIEIGQELLRVTRIEEPTRALTWQRGVLNTTAAAHTAADMITVKPEITRKQIYNAVSDAIVNMGPRLYGVATTQYDSSDSLISVLATVDDVIHYRYKSSEASTGITTYLDGTVELQKNLHADVSSTTVAIQTHGIPSGRTGYLTYKLAFPRPTAESYILDDTTNNIEPEWFMLVKLGAVIRLVSSWDLSARNNDFIAEALQAQGFPVGSGESVDLAMVRIYQYLMREAESRLMKDTPMQVITNRPG